MTKLKQTSLNKISSQTSNKVFFLMDNAPQDIAPIQNHSLFKLYFKNTCNVEDVKNEIHTTGNVCVLNALKTIASSCSFPSRRTYQVVLQSVDFNLI